MLLQMAGLPFLWLKNTPLYTYYIFFIHSSIDAHLGCSHVLALVSNASVNMAVHISLLDSDFISFRYTPRSGIAGSYGSSMFNIIYLFIFREEGKEKERERNINVWLPLAHPPLGTWPKPRHGPWPGMDPVTLWFAGLCSVRWATPARAIFNILKNLHTVSIVTVSIYLPTKHTQGFAFLHFLALPSFYIVGKLKPREGKET